MMPQAYWIMSKRVDTPSRVLIVDVDITLTEAYNDQCPVVNNAGILLLV